MKTKNVTSSINGRVFNSFLIHFGRDQFLRPPGTHPPDPTLRDQPARSLRYGWRIDVSSAEHILDKYPHEVSTVSANVGVSVESGGRIFFCFAPHFVVHVLCAKAN